MIQNNKILAAVTDFIKGGDESNVEKLNNVLHKNFVNTQNGFFEQKGVIVIDKEKYLSLINEKIFGGIHRDINIVTIDEIGNIALVKAELKSEKLKFISFISLVLDEDNKWKVVGNLPFIETNN